MTGVPVVLAADPDVDADADAAPVEAALDEGAVEVGSAVLPDNKSEVSGRLMTGVPVLATDPDVDGDVDGATAVGSEATADSVTDADAAPVEAALDDGAAEVGSAVLPGNKLEVSGRLITGVPVELVAGADGVAGSDSVADTDTEPVGAAVEDWAVEVGSSLVLGSNADVRVEADVGSGAAEDWEAVEVGSGVVSGAEDEVGETRPEVGKPTESKGESEDEPPADSVDVACLVEVGAGVVSGASEDVSAADEDVADWVSRDVDVDEGADEEDADDVNPSTKQPRRPSQLEEEALVVVAGLVEVGADVGS
ncbi:hypothetical protein BN14_05433 [Rhizoctonia solani AG-1 IB]|uniref:Uncharacterized protein n=1 Tax=Thanatephorus cucumeris (strain AG1-IB / isolate 7/3/14) TaxID=1108050 RepID=M5C681_THACB|nr:hypothetical protein BN14_05433 [Rhizoctonia solani AG-1 IB]